MPQLKPPLLCFTILILRWYQICLQDVVLKHIKRFPFYYFPVIMGPTNIDNAKTKVCLTDKIKS